MAGHGPLPDAPELEHADARGEKSARKGSSTACSTGQAEVGAGIDRADSTDISFETGPANACRGTTTKYDMLNDSALFPQRRH
eukprot:2758715-Pleurochrysis_carterae.AAC.1